MSDPLDAGSDGQNGRRVNGQFAPGHRFAKGNPFARRGHAIRAALFKAVKPSDVRAAVEKLVEAARNGDRHALAELLDRTIGKAVPADLEERLSSLEAAAAQRQNGARAGTGLGHDGGIEHV